MQKLLYTLPLLLLTCLVNACASMPQPNFVPADVAPASRKIDADLKSLTVTVAGPDEATGKLDRATFAAAPLWKEALQASLDKFAIFTDDSPRKVAISAKILELDPPAVGFEMVTKSAARYQLIDRANGAILYTKDVHVDGTVPATYAFVGVIRARESINRSVQNNILDFLHGLEASTIQFQSATSPTPGLSKN